MKLILLPFLATVLSFSDFHSVYAPSLNKSIDRTERLVKHYNSVNKPVVYRVLKKTKYDVGSINENDIKRLNEPLIALAAFYSAMGGTVCNTVRVDYKVLYYDRGTEKWNQGPDYYTLKNNKFKMLKRNIWKHIK